MSECARPGAELAAVATEVERLAALLQAGVPPGAAWRYLAEAGGSAVAAAAASAEPGTIATAIAAASERSQAWRGVAAAWSVALDAGAPLAPALRASAGALRGLANAERSIRVALASPTSTARMVMLLPLVGILFGIAMGFDTIAVLTTNPVGIACLARGTVLMVVGRRWTNRLVAAARPTDLSPGLASELLAIAVSGGASLDRARAAVADALERLGIDARADRAESALALSQRAGVPAADLLRSEADEERRSAIADAEERAARLATTLMLPLGVCVLPAFMLVGVAPLIISIISSTIAAF